jgi:D-alanine-D-alanine ligase
MELRLIYNLRTEYPNKQDKSPLDIDAEWDIPDTIYFLKQTLEKIGFNVIDICCDHEITTNISASSSLVFNICEMTGGSYREALIPSLCEILRIPYVFSKPDVMVKALDKNICNLVMRQSKINVPDWLNIKNIEDIKLLIELDKYPYIVKPASEGSGIGISNQSVLYSYTELVNRVKYIMSEYRQPVLVQKY